MKYLYTVIAVIALFVIIFEFLSFLPPKKFLFTGKVIEEVSGIPIEGASITFEFDEFSKETKHAATNEDGFFSLVTPFDDLEHISVSKPGYSFREVSRNLEDREVFMSFIFSGDMQH